MVLQDDENPALIRDSDSAVVWIGRTGPLFYGSGTQPYFP